MISLSKHPMPDILERNGARWTNELLKLIADGVNPTDYLLSRYSHPDIKSALLLETSEKCAYCESAFRHVTYGDVEHILPKRANPELRFNWQNLTVACDICNTNKAEHELIDPYVDNPANAFVFCGPVIWAKPDNDRAMLSEIRLDLNRTALVQRRQERLEFLRNLIISAFGKPPDVRDAILDKARREVAETQPFSACTKAALEKIAEMVG